LAHFSESLKRTTRVIADQREHPLENSVSEIPIEWIEADNDNRISSGSSLDVSDLVNSFSKHGQFSPIMVRKHSTLPNKYQVIFGNRRLRAAKALSWRTIKASVVKSLDFESQLISFSENVDRENFSDYEKARLIERLHKLSNKSYSEIAELIGKSPSYVSLHIAMLHLFPEGVASKTEVERVLVALTEKHARALARINSNDERWATAKLAVIGKLSVRELEREYRLSRKGRRRIRGQTEKASIEQVIRENIAALNSKDLGRFFSLIYPKYYVMFSRFPPLNELDRDTAESHMCNLLKQMEDFSISIKDLEIHVFGKFAFGTLSLIHRFRISLSETETLTRVTVILVKNQTWKIVHEHWSSANSMELARSLPTLEKTVAK
jgi:ParB family transcriptional regulator, chromosome partitioning protein